MKRKLHFNPRRGELKTVRHFKCLCGHTIEFIAVSKIKRPNCYDGRIELTVSGGEIVPEGGNTNER